MALLIHEVKERLTRCCDPETFVDILELSIDQLMDAFEEEMMDKLDTLDNTFDLYGEEFDEYR